MYRDVNDTGRCCLLRWWVLVGRADHAVVGAGLAREPLRAQSLPQT